MTTQGRFWPLADLNGIVALNIVVRSLSLWTAQPQTRGRARRAMPPLIAGSSDLWYTLHPDNAASPQARSALQGNEQPNPTLARHLLAICPGLPLCDAIVALLRGEYTVAHEATLACKAVADATWLAGMLALRSGALGAARSLLATALENPHALGNDIDNLGVCLTVTVPLTSAITAHVGPCPQGTQLVLGAIAQQQGDHVAALTAFERLTTLVIDDPVATLMLAELAQEAGQEEVYDGQLLRLTERITNSSPVHAALLIHRARSLRREGMPFRAIATYNEALRLRKGRSVAMLNRIRYERALIHEALGWRARARRVFEQLHATAPGFEDVAARIAGPS